MLNRERIDQGDFSYEDLHNLLDYTSEIEDLLSEAVQYLSLSHTNSYLLFCRFQELGIISKNE